MTTPTREQVLQWANEAATKTVDWDLTGKPITDADVLIMGAFGDLMVRIATLARADLEAQLAERDAEIAILAEARENIWKALKVKEAEIAALKGNVSHLQMALADTEALELGTAEKVIQQQAHIERLKEALEIGW